MQTSVERGTELNLLLGDVDEHVACRGAPHLSPHGARAVVQEVLGTQVLFNPPDEQFKLPGVLVQRADLPEDQRLPRCRVFREDVPKVLELLRGRGVAGEYDARVADDAGAAVGGRLGHASGVHGRLRANDEERTGLMQWIQPSEVDVAAIRSKRRPVQQASAQIDGVRVLRMNSVVQIGTEPEVARVELRRAAEQQGRKVQVAALGARLVGIDQRGALRRRAKARRVELGGIGQRASHDVAQALTSNELRKGHGTELLGARAPAHTRIAAAALQYARKALSDISNGFLEKPPFAWKSSNPL